jgi:hypothetical protein
VRYNSRGDPGLLSVLPPDVCAENVGGKKRGC